MPRVVPVLAKYTLDHFVRNRIFRVRIRSLASAIETEKVLVVRVVFVGFMFWFIRGRSFSECTFLTRNAACGAIAAEISFGVEFDKFMIFMALVTASQADSSSL